MRSQFKTDEDYLLRIFFFPGPKVKTQFFFSPYSSLDDLQSEILATGSFAVHKKPIWVYGAES